MPRGSDADSEICLVDTLNLSSRCLSNIEWEKHTSATSQNPRVPKPSEAYKGGSFYTTQVAVPVSLPKGNKVFVPSFHSCLVSRIYALDLYLSVNTPSTTLTDPTIHLKLPIQVSSEGNPHAKPMISAGVSVYELLILALNHALTLVNLYRNTPQ